MDMSTYFSGIQAIFKYSFRKILFNRKWLLTGLVMLLVVLVMGYAGSQEMDSLDGGSLLMDVLILTFIMPVISMIYGSSLIRNEIEDKSITQVITAPLDRIVSYVGYYISLAVALSVIMVAINLVGWLAFFSQKGINGDSLGILASFCGLSVLGAMAYAALFQATGVIFKRPVYFGLFFAFIWESFIGSIPGLLNQYTIKHYIASIGSSWLEYGSLASYNGVSSGAALLVLIIITIVCLAIGGFIFREKEYP